MRLIAPLKESTLVDAAASVRLNPASAAHSAAVPFKTMPPANKRTTQIKYKIKLLLLIIWAGGMLSASLSAAVFSCVAATGLRMQDTSTKTAAEQKERIRNISRQVTIFNKLDTGIEKIVPHSPYPIKSTPVAKPERPGNQGTTAAKMALYAKPTPIPLRML